MKHHIIHHADADGHGAAAVVYLHLVTNCDVAVDDIKFIRTNYGWPLRDEEINYENDFVYIVDYCLQPYNQMKDMSDELGDRLTWIDHHVTSIDCEEQFGLEQVRGIRSIKLSGCELTWKYYFNKPMPVILDLIGTWDTFRRDDEEKWEHEVLPFQSYLFATETRPHVNITFWHRILELALKSKDLERAELDSLVAKGRMMRRYQVAKEDSLMRQVMFRGKFAGHTAMIANAGQVSSLCFERQKGAADVDLLVSFCWIKADHWRINLYTLKDDVDCGRLSKRLGYEGPMRSGGGHPKAAGFQTDTDHLMSYIETEKGLIQENPKVRAENWSVTELREQLALVVLSLRTKRDDCQGKDERLYKDFTRCEEVADQLYDNLGVILEEEG